MLSWLNGPESELLMLVEIIGAMVQDLKASPILVTFPGDILGDRVDAV